MTTQKTLKELLKNEYIVVTTIPVSMVKFEKGYATRYILLDSATEMFQLQYCGDPKHLRAELEEQGIRLE